MILPAIELVSESAGRPLLPLAMQDGDVMCFSPLDDGALFVATDTDEGAIGGRVVECLHRTHGPDVVGPIGEVVGSTHESGKLFDVLGRNGAGLRRPVVLFIDLTASEYERWTTRRGDKDWPKVRSVTETMLRFIMLFGPKVGIFTVYQQRVQPGGHVDFSEYVGLLPGVSIVTEHGGASVRQPTMVDNWRYESTWWDGVELL